MASINDLKENVKSGFRDITSGREDRITKSIEQQTARVPFSSYLLLAVGAMGISAGLKLAGRDEAALFVGQWAAPFLLLGIYNKLVKQLGSEGEHAPTGNVAEFRERPAV